jgi:DNA helicase-2/ATP-dependent DNA helicase PcrA
MRLRKAQEQVATYKSGKMAVMAVPGSGKTFTLSYLAAQLVEQLTDAGLADEQEVLIVTFTNPAVNSFRKRIADLLHQQRGLLPYVGYRVRTLHGLAHDVVRMRPGLVGLAEGFEIVDESISAAIMRDLSEHWIRTSGEELLQYIDLPLAQDQEQLTYLIRKNGPELIEYIANDIKRLGKDNQWDPSQMRTALDKEPHDDLVLAKIGIGLYEEYQRSLGYRGAVDFDDLVRLAMLALKSDPEYLKRLQTQWPYILEDEAQDSSQLQNEMLSLLSGNKNWVRVGDPNQSIYTTFTTANANLLRRFSSDSDVVERPLPESGRSSPGIIALANELVRWSRTDPLIPHLHDALSNQQIEPTAPDDYQPNPPDGQIYIDWDPEKNITPEQEIERVVKSLEKWLPDNPDSTVAVLVPENSRGFKVAEALQERDLPYEELLRSTSATRDAAAKLQAVFDFLADPISARALGTLYGEVWWPLATGVPEDEGLLQERNRTLRLLQEISATENYLWPGPDGDWLKAIAPDVDAYTLSLLEGFRQRLRIWVKASILPVGQLILTIAQDLFKETTDLALTYKIAVVMNSIAESNPDYRLPELSQELRQIAQNQRRFLGFDDAATGYEPRKGTVTIATMHAAKGLEWDRVYLMAVNNYSFPAALPADSYQSEKWFIRNNLNLQAEAQEQVTLLMKNRSADYSIGEATLKARIEYAAERLRLLYVGITRARRDLIITWNMGRFWEQGRKNEGAAALLALSAFWKKELQSS